MKTLLSIFALTLELAFTGAAFTSPAFAGDVKNAKSEQDCVREGGSVAFGLITNGRRLRSR